MGSDSYRVYDPVRLSGQEIEKANASIAAAAAAARGRRRFPRPAAVGISRDIPTPRQAPAIAMDARGRMYESAAEGKKTSGSVSAITAGMKPPTGSRRRLTGTLLNRNRVAE